MDTNAVSARLNSSAMDCRVASVCWCDEGRRITDAGLPVNGVLVKASTWAIGGGD